MSYRSWTRAGNTGAVLIAAAFAVALLRLPGWEIAAPWLLASGFGAGIASIIGRRSARRRAHAEAEAAAAAELDGVRRKRRL